MRLKTGYYEGAIPEINGDLLHNHNHIERGCTGFDGGFEIVEAIRRLGLRHQLRNKIKRKQ